MDKKDKTPEASRLSGFRCIPVYYTNTNKEIHTFSNHNPLEWFVVSISNSVFSGV